MGFSILVCYLSLFPLVCFSIWRQANKTYHTLWCEAMTCKEEQIFHFHIFWKVIFIQFRLISFLKLNFTTGDGLGLLGGNLLDILKSLRCKLISRLSTYSKFAGRFSHFSSSQNTVKLNQFYLHIDFSTIRFWHWEAKFWSKISQKIFTSNSRHDILPIRLSAMHNGKNIDS